MVVLAMHSRRIKKLKSHFTRWWTVVMALWLVGTAAVWAQQPTDNPPLAIAKHFSPDPVPAGEEITYQLTITHTGDSPLTGVTVTDIVPPQTTFVMTSVPGDDWWMQTPQTGEQGEIAWRLVGPLTPGQVTHLHFVVLTKPNNADPIIGPGCRVTIEGWDTMTGEAVTTQVILPVWATLPPPTPVPTLAPLTTPLESSTDNTPTATPKTSPTNTFTQSPVRSSLGLATLLIGTIVIGTILAFFLIQLGKKRRILQ
ncbi:MAG: DUF11 domain-containing protein [Chloroflexi bacterium]|nr:DUF11 domain-containing protein [Chloroflexota bacterium]